MPERCEKRRWPQTVQAGLGVPVLISLRWFVQRSCERRVRRMRRGWLVRSLRASVVWMEAAKLTAVERMPAVSQVSTGPVGGLGKMQARQAVGSTLSVASSPFSVVEGGLGRMFMVAA